MSITRFTWVLFAVAAAVAGPFTRAGAQEARPAARDPADPKASVPPVRYESAFARYRPNAEAEVGVWRDANDRVGRIGGWRVYGRESMADAKDDAAAGSDAIRGAAKAAHEHGHARREGR